ncbi:MAG: PadR family transcriptional regulator [Solirubrobacterales bacterium]|nr:PadR family transcriptional regulator [Solirubrobacterales bacterium]
MPSADEQMPPSEWAVLALLAEGPTHGFALARAMAEDGEIGRVWSLRRPRVYYAIEALTRRGLARPDRTVPSRSGPDRTVLRITPAGRRAVTEWLGTPIEHIRDARSLLLLKLLFLDRRGSDPGPLLAAQRERFERIADRLQKSVNETRGFDQTLLRWRLETATAALRFIDSVM